MNAKYPDNSDNNSDEWQNDPGNKSDDDHPYDTAHGMSGELGTFPAEWRRMMGAPSRNHGPSGALGDGGPSDIADSPTQTQAPQSSPYTSYTFYTQPTERLQPFTQTSNTQSLTPFEVPASNHPGPPTDPAIRKIWEQGPAGRFWQQRQQMQAYTEAHAQPNAQGELLTYDELLSSAWPNIPPVGRMTSEALSHPMRRNEGLREPSLNDGGHGGGQFPPGPPTALGDGHGHGGQAPYRLPMTHLAVTLSPSDIAAGGLMGEPLRLLRQEEESMRHAVAVTAPMLGQTDKVPVCLMMEHIRFRYPYASSGSVLQYRTSEGVRPILNPALPPHLLSTMSAVEGAEEMSFSPLTFPGTMTIQEMDNHFLRPSSLEGGGFAFFIEHSPLLRLLTALYYCRFYLRLKLMSVALERSMKDLYDVPTNLKIYWHPRAPQGTYFGTRRHGEVLWMSWHGRYYTELWRQASILLCSHALLDAQTDLYRQVCDVSSVSGSVPALGPDRYHAVVRWTRSRFHDESYPAEVAWSQYKQWLADRNCVPRAVIESRLDPFRGDWQVRDFEDYAKLTAQLLKDQSTLQQLRAGAAHTLRCSPDETVLWLLEPLRWSMM